jgi:hypothetical protein
MGKGLSPLQKSILAALEHYPALEDFPTRVEISLATWARPLQIMQRLGLPSTAANRAALSRALSRLYGRGLVARASGAMASQGKSFRYVRITDPVNAYFGSAGPVLRLNRPASRLRTVRTA